MGFAGPNSEADRKALDREKELLMRGSGEHPCRQREGQVQRP